MENLMENIMENLLLSADEHKLLLGLKSYLESRHGLSLNLPEVDVNNPSCGSDVIFGSISGERRKINLTKVILKRRLRKLVASRKKQCSMDGDIPIITISDSETSIPVIVTKQQKRNKKRRLAREKSKGWIPNHMFKVGIHAINRDCEVSSTTGSDSFNMLESGGAQPTAAMALFNSFATTTNAATVKRRKKRTAQPNPQKMFEEELQRVQNENLLPAAADFIPLFSGNHAKKDHSCNDDSVTIFDESVIILDEVPRLVQNVNQIVPKPVQTRNEIFPWPVPVINQVVPRPIEKNPRLLRPIVIDGSNVAREHGKNMNTFSSKGIQIAVDHFLQRGHTQVTAFVPNFRRHCLTYGPVLTTNVELLEALALSQHVVFTPSRKVNGKRVTCYDDRFIVELASKTGGVILSNDNYKDLLGESADFKKTIEERLLMFCFVGDLLMIPNDPLGRHGPCLNEYLSCPATVGNSAPNCFLL